MCRIVLCIVETNVPIWVIFLLTSFFFDDSVKVTGYLTALLVYDGTQCVKTSTLIL